MTIKNTALLILSSIFCTEINAAGQEDLLKDVEITVEAQASASDGTTPLWLNANKYGLSSLESNNGYVRGSIIRDVENDDRRWKWGYGVDIVAGANYNAKAFVHQAFAEMKYEKLRLTLGAKEQPAECKDNTLTSGALTMGTNARPIPQARLHLDWFSIPGTNGWWKWKLFGSFGMTTDGGWQESVVPESEHYTSNVLYHEKALYWKFGKEDHEAFPLTYELSLQMAAFFGGTTYNAYGRDIEKGSTIEHPTNLMAFVHAITATGSDENDGSSRNTAGNHIGSWNMRLTWHGEDWKASARFERMFEDQSMMFIQYGIYDHLVGLDVTLPKNSYVSALTIEHMSSYDQSGAILHDAAPNIPDKMNGRDNYYNHNMYVGYQHWGQTLGNPLLTSPVYNSNGSLIFWNNRVRAWHLGIKGSPADWLSWRVFATVSHNWGNYDRPLEDPTWQQYYMAEAMVTPRKLSGWQGCLGIGLDHGKVIGNNFGIQLTIRKTMHL